MPGEMADQNIKAKKAGSNNYEEKPVGGRRKKKISTQPKAEVEQAVVEENN